VDKRLATFITMLGSNHPGEVATAASMLVKALKNHGRDLHWLASKVNAPASNDADIRVITRLRDELAVANLELAKSRAHALKLECQVRELLAKQPPTSGQPTRDGGQQANHHKSNPTWPEKARWSLAYGSDNRLLSSRDSRFVKEMTIRRQDTPLSPKQESWLEEIYQRLRRAEAAER
jgi:hypothetical protein